MLVKAARQDSADAPTPNAGARHEAEHDQPVADGGRMASRRRAILAAAAGAALLSIGGLIGAAFVKSPSQAAADTRAPKPSVIIALVQSEVLRNTVVLRGTFSQEATVAAQPTTVASTSASPAGSGVSDLVVTGVFVHAGETVGAAKPLMEYSGRPVFALPGAIPVYRDLLPGESGKDIAQLQKALRKLGYSTYPDTTGTFSTGTEDAVRQLYQAMGYPVPVTMSQPAASTAPDQQTGASQPPVEKTPTTTPTPVPLPMVPASELIFVPTLPARVASVPVSVGDQVKGPVVTLAQGGPTLTGMLDPSDSGLVKTGMSVQIMDDTTGLTAAGTVASVGAVTTGPSSQTSGASGAGAMDSGDPGAGAITGAYAPLAITPTNPWPAQFDGENVRITITAAATSGPVLAVPEAAISAGADSMTSVTVVTPDGSQVVIPVTAGVSANGMVQVTAHGGALRPGDKVVVGQ